MTEVVKLNVSNGGKSTSPFSINVTNKEFINSVVTVKDNNVITTEDMNLLIETAKRAGDLGVLEEEDFSPEQKLKMAELNEYGEFYDIKLSDDGNFFEITVKQKAALLSQYPDPTVGVICNDFGISTDVFKSNNKRLLEEITDNSKDKNGHDSSNDVVPSEKTFKIPINDCHFLSGPTGFVNRFIYRIGSWF